MLDGADAGLFEQAAVDGVVHMGQGYELPDVALAEAVDGLFAVAHHEGGVAGAHTVLQQGDEVLPLQTRGVLEFVNKIVVIAVANALVDEGDGFVLHHLGDALVELGDMDDFVLLGIVVDEQV